MPEKPMKIALVGASTLIGKALGDELANSAFASADLYLLDGADEVGKLVTAADEVAIIQQLEDDSFDRCDFAFFAGAREQTLQYWMRALKAGARVIDLSGALEQEPGVIVRAPWLQEESLMSAANSTQSIPAGPDLQTRAVVSAHPVSVLLALLARRSQSAAPLRNLWATLLQPASEYGHAALEELHQQTTNLLSFQPLPTEVFGSQTAFNLAVSLGSEGRVRLMDAFETIRRDYEKILPGQIAPLALQVVQVPVFHGYALSISLEFNQPVSFETLMEALAGPHVRILADPTHFPGSVQAVEEQDAQVLLQPVPSEASSIKSAASESSAVPTTRFWLWVLADNLNFAARNAIACAVELNRLRPRGTVQ